jgi:hypothetical protein
MAKLNYGPAKKFLYNCQYLVGKEITVKTRKGESARGTIIGFGASGSIAGKIELWAKVKDNRTGRIMQVELMGLYKSVPRGSSDNHKAEVSEAPSPEAIGEASEAH